jgi:hypothetical protein
MARETATYLSLGTSENKTGVPTQLSGSANHRELSAQIRHGLVVGEYPTIFEHRICKKQLRMSAFDVFSNSGALTRESTDRFSYAVSNFFQRPLHGC